MEQFRTRFPWAWSIAAFVVGLLALLYLWPQAEPQAVETVTYGPIPTLEQLEDGGYLLPFEEGDPGKRLPGRPEEPMPIPRQIYKSTEISIDGQPVTQEPIHFSAGAQIRIDGMITRNPKVPMPIGGGSIGWVTRADNHRGWLVDMQLNVHDADQVFSKEGVEFTGLFSVPETPGEYVLVVISDYNVGSPKGMPILLAGAYDAIVTAADAPSP